MSKFATRKWIVVNDLSNGLYSVEKNLRFKTPMLRSDLCDYRDPYIAVKGLILLTITIRSTNDHTRRNKLAFKNNAPFKSCISKINYTFIDTAQDLDIVVPM